MNGPPEVQIDALFSTLLFRHVYPDSDALNAALRDLILERAKSVAGQTKSNVGGWQSSEDFHRLRDPAVQTLVARAAEVVNFATGHVMRQYQAQAEIAWKLLMWANVNGTGDYNLPHLHPGSTWSGVYYVDPGDAPPADDPFAGAIAFENPNTAALMSFFGKVIPSFIDIQPVAGEMLLFPSYLVHFVRPYRGTRRRISIAFNVLKTPYP